MYPFLYPSSISAALVWAALVVGHMTRLTDGFSEKSENLKSAAYALHFAHMISVGFIHRSNVPRGNGSQDHKARLEFAALANQNAFTVEIEPLK